MDVQHVAEVLGGEAVLGMRVRSLSDLEGLIRGGLPKASLRFAAERIAEDRAQATAIIHQFIPESTFKRRRRLNVAESERSERLARVVALAEFVWGDPAAAHRWLRNAHPLLDGRTPLEASTLEIGARQVEEVLYRAIHGIPA
jgi:putative toxin-antitoxin system antitoxin component (TIGR02293 family)